MALKGGPDGLDGDSRDCRARAGDYLAAGGWLLLEHGYDQADRVQALLRDAGFGASRVARAIWRGFCA